ncbi:MAG: ribbon-helix-helix domain-containing protein [Acidimicrobiaceae bacterium]|nr:ribbon-helix-helix domain-containing protein [Acidimicrobiaceae bacterium]
MRTTVTLADDVAAAIEQIKRSEGIGVSEAINRLVRKGLAKPDTLSQYVHRSYDMDMKVDVTNIGEVIGLLDEFDPPC